jgi:prepilin-type N-terminal cleavage/methylation domain-containing protein
MIAPRTLSRRGYTMIEVVVVVAITGIAVAFLYNVFNSLYRSYRCESLEAGMRQNARVALDTVVRDINMAGYHITRYGDDNKADLAVTRAETDKIEFDLHRLDIDTNTYESKMIYYHLATDVSTGKQNLYRQVRDKPGLPAPDELVAENMTGFSLAYFDGEGNALTTLPSQYTFGNPPPQLLKDIRQVEVDVKAGTEVQPDFCASYNAASGAFDWPELELSTRVVAKNLAVSGETTCDSIPPAVPTGLRVVDSRDCDDKLSVKWSKNTDLDLEGYVIHYGAGKQRKVSVSDLADKDNPEKVLSPADLLITKNADRTTSPNTYSISVSAYDSCGNYSSWSAPTATNPLPDITSFASAGNDTTVNPVKPAIAQGFTVAAGGAYELSLTWSSPLDDGTTGADESSIVGYRLYRSENPFTDGANINGIFLLADEAALDAGATSWSDAGLEACRPYYYALASVNCDETLVDTYLFDAGGAGDYAQVTNVPNDDTTPANDPTRSPPDLAGSSKGWQRLFVVLDNPTADEFPDFVKSEVYFSKDGTCPSISSGNVVDGTLIPNGEGGSPGTFPSRGSQSFVFVDEGQPPPAAPALDETSQYCLLGVAYDNCGVYLASPPVQLIPDEVCDDFPAGPPTGWPSAPTYTSCDPEWVSLTWEYPDKDSIADFAGYRLWRRGPQASTYVELTGAPVQAEAWKDARDLQEGGSYRYEVKVTDRAYENCNATFPTNISLPLDIPSSTGWITPGRVVPFGCDLDPLAPWNFVTVFSDGMDPSAPFSDDPFSYTWHNNVRFFLQNTSAGPMRVESMTVAWQNENAQLRSVTIGGPPSSTAANTALCTPLNPQSNLATALSETATSLSVGSVASFPEQGTVVIDSEDIAYTSRDAVNNILHGVQRGFGGTSAQSHSAGALVRLKTGLATCSMNATITDVATGVGTSSVPVPAVLRFSNDDGSVNRFTDMRGDRFEVSMGVRNLSLQQSTCDPEVFTVRVPEGPELRDFFQGSAERFLTPSLSVPGESGATRDDDLELPAATDINVFGTVVDSSSSCGVSGSLGFGRLTLFQVTDTVAAAGDVPTMPTGTPPAEFGLQNLGGTDYAIFDPATLSGTKIPSVADGVSWYFLLAVDRAGNFDRHPSPEFGDFAYHQGAFDICAVKPEPPVLHGTSTPGSVSLDWDAPDYYTNGGDLNDPPDSLLYDVLVWEVPGGSPAILCGDTASLSCSHSEDMTIHAFAYSVKAKNGCSPTARESDFSNVYYECEGDQDFCPLFTVSPGRISLGDSVTVAAGGICFFAGNGTTDTVTFRVSSGLETEDFTAVELSDSGTFEVTFATTSAVADDDELGVNADDLLTAEFITGSIVRETKYASVGTFGCSDTPAVPSSFTVVRGGAGGEEAVIGWNAVSDIDLAGYEVEYRACDNTNHPCDSWPGSTWAPTDTGSPQITEDVCAESSTLAVEPDREYEFRVRSFDSCSTPQHSDWTNSVILN